MAEDTKKTPPTGLRPLADNDPRRARVERVAALIRQTRMPGKLEDGGDESKPIDASFEALALDVGATTLECFLCKKEVLEFVIWRIMCPHCDLEIIRCRTCDPEGSIAKDTYERHCESAHPELWTTCTCGIVTMQMRKMQCPTCGLEIERCRERCDALAVLDAHRKEHVTEEA